MDRRPSERSIPAPELVFPDRRAPEALRQVDEKELTTMIEHVMNLDELDELLSSIQEIPGASSQPDKLTGKMVPFSGLACAKRIEGVRCGKQAVEIITRACGIRAAVERLLPEDTKYEK